MYKIVLYIALICIIFTTLSNAQRSPRASTTSTSSETPSNSVSRSTGASNSISASLTGSVSQSVTRTVTPSTTSTNTASATNTPSNAPSGAASNTPTNTVTPTASVTPSGTSSISVTPSGTSSSSVTPSNSGSSSITPSISGSSSNTPSSSATPSTTPSTTRSITATPSSSFIPIANNTVSCLYCNRESIYRSRNASSNAFIAASNLGLVSSSPSGTPSISTTPSNTPSISVTPSTTPSNTPSISVTPSITPSISTSSSPSSSASPSSSSSASASISGTSSNTPSISASSSISPSFSPSASALGNSSIINSQTICGTGSFRTDGGILTLVYNTSQQGAAYFNQTYNLTEGFLVQFDVHLYQPTPDIVTGPNGERYNKPADGFAFCAQQDSYGCNAVGYNGEGIGYDGIENALCVEFDVYFNNPYGDPDSDHIAVMASDALGALVSANHDSSSAVTPPLSLLNTSSSLYPRDGYPFDVNHTVRVTYDGTDEVLEVTLNGRSLILINSTKVRDLQLNGALLGFTSSTGGYGETVDISSFFARVPWSRPPSASPTPSASASASSGLVLIPTGLARKEHFDD